MSKNIIFVQETFPPTITGSSIRVFKLSSELSRMGYNIHVLTTGINNPGITRIETHRLISRYRVTRDGLRNPIDAIIFSYNAAKKLKQLNNRTPLVVDINISPLYPTILFRTLKYLRYLKNIELVLTMHECWLLSWFKYHALHAIPGIYLEIFNYLSADKIVSVSHTNRRKILSFIPSLSDRIKIIPNGIDKELLNFYSYKGKIHTSYDIMLVVSRLFPHKNVISAIKIFEKLRQETKEVKLYIIGDGPLLQDVMCYIRKKSLSSITIVRHLKRVKMLKLFSTAKLFLLPSLREGFSIATLEAMATGLPPVCRQSTDSAVKDFITNGVNGFLYTHHEEAVRYIIPLLQDRKLYKEISRNAHHTASLYTWDKIVKRYESEILR